MDIETEDKARQATLEAIQHWHTLSDLVEFAIARHGYMNTDGFFGITYPDDLDAYDRDVLVLEIPEGYIEATAWYGERHGPNYLLPEQEYIELLRQVLCERGMNDLAEKLP